MDVLSNITFDTQINLYSSILCTVHVMTKKIKYIMNRKTIIYNKIAHNTIETNNIY